MPDSVTVWVARDKSPLKGCLAMWSYTVEPKRREDGSYYYVDKPSHILAPLDHLQYLFPVLKDLRPEDGPKRIKLTLEVLD